MPLLKRSTALAPVGWLRESSKQIPAIFYMAGMVLWLAQYC
jgi:hypothetical protein